MNELFIEYQQFRRILCLCPNCNEISRVSDLHLFAGVTKEGTWLDEYDRVMLLLDRKEEVFGVKEERLRELAVAQGRKQAAKIFNKMIDPSFRALKFDPFDVKPILNPVDFVIFDGMNKKEQIDEVVFLSKLGACHPALSGIREQVKKVIQDRNYDWQVARITSEGKIELS